MMSHRRERPYWTWLLISLAYALSLLALVIVLSGCKNESTRPPNENDVVRQTARASVHPCRCGTRPPVLRR